MNLRPKMNGCPQNFNAVPNIDLRDPNLKMLDLNGDGKADIWCPKMTFLFGMLQKGKKVSKAIVQTVKPLTRKRPQYCFADSTQSIVLSDMSGDGLMDIVRIETVILFTGQIWAMVNSALR